MDRNVDMMRLLLLELERRERSPAEPVFLPLDELAARLGTDREAIVDALQSLRERDFIEAPGPYRDQWLFRKLTRRGAALLGLVADEGEWRKVKRAYGLLIEG
jgi:DNA-binding MarR family transcriptional regulator